MVKARITVPEAERLAAEEAEKISMRHWRMRYLDGKITKARAGFSEAGKLVRCGVYQGDELLSEMQTLGSRAPVQWIELRYTPEGGWELLDD